MARKRARRKPRSDEAPGWVWMLFGLAIGLVVALGVYVNGPSSTAPPDEAATTAAVASAERAMEPEAVAAESGVGASNEPDPDRFSFYELLPQFEVVIPDAEAPEPRTAAAPAAIVEPGRYLIRAGSFRTIGRADARQANIGMLGIESSIRPATVDGEVYYRVLIGPFNDLEALNDARRRLLDAEIDNDLLRDTATGP